MKIVSAINFICSISLMALVIHSGVWAAGKAHLPPERNWSFSGLFGGFDRASARRGFQVYQEVCSGCHSLNLLSYRHLSGLDFSDDEIKEIAAEVEVVDGPNEEGEMFERPGIPADPFVSPFSNAKEAAAANNGKMPPDLSLITKARKGGADYLFALLTGYSEQVPEGMDVPEEAAYNKYYPGQIIAMTAPLSEDSVEYPDGTKASVDQLAEDVTIFLAWAAEPELEARKKLGIKVLIFLIVLTGMLYVVKRKVWDDLH